MATDRTHPAVNWKALTAGSNIIEPTPASIFVGGAGNIVAEGKDGVSVTFAATDGSILPIQPIRITSATATGIIALYN